jgi:SAM-dependent methyltransferase
VRVARPERRLEGFWGAVDRRHNAEILKRIAGGPVLDLGCGYGTLTEALTQAGFDAVGVDANAASLEVARRRSPGCRFECANAGTLPFVADEFGTVVLRDSLHHLVNEGEWPAVAAELQRVLGPRGRVVVLDPNITPILRAARVLICHQDEVCTVERARSEIEALGLRVSEVSYNTLFSLPLSGGYVGLELVPRSARLRRVLLGLELTLERLLARARLLRRLAWRYVLVADRT